MTGGDLADRVLLALLDANEGDDPGTDLRTLGDAVGLEDALAAWLRLASTCSELEADGLVTTADGEETGDATVRLTAAGRERAVVRYASIATKQVVVVTADERRELPLRAVSDAYDVSLPRALADLSPDGRLYLETDPEPAVVGREDERRRLLDLLETAREGRPAAALLTGEPGIGKTALVERLCADASERGWAVAVGRCRRDGGGPYHPFEDAFDTGETASAAPFPGIDSTPAPAHDEATYETRLAVAYDRAVDWFEDRARDGALLLVLEDLHWADAATIDLLEHLLAAVDDVPLAVCCTARSTDPDAVDRLEPVADAVSGSDAGLRLDLGPLDREAVTELVERRVGRRGVPPSFVDAVFEETGGNPLFVAETVAGMLEDGTIDPAADHYPDDPDAVAVADVVETTVERRLERLESETRAVLEVGAVVGAVVPIDRLRAVTDCAASAVRARVDRLVAARFWERVDDGTVRFRSDVARSVVREAVCDERTARLHRRIADAMAGDESRTAHATIAAHYERGERPERALEHWIAAGDRATELYAHDDAVAWYERALRIARDRDRTETVLELLESLGDVHYTRGEYERADRRFRYVRERTDDPERIRRTYRYQARVRFERGDYEATEQYASAGLAVGDGEAATREGCWLRDYEAGSHLKRGNLERAIEGFTAQRDLAARLGDDLLLGRAYQNLGVCVSNRGEVERGVDYLERAVPLLEAADDDRELARCLNDLAIGYHRDNRFDRAAETFRRSRRLARETGSLRAAMLAVSNLGVIACWQARWDDARSAFEETSEAATRSDNEEMRGFALAKRALVERETGDLEAATRDLERGLEILRGVESRYHCAQFAADLGRLYLLRGSLDRAAAEIDRAVELATERGYPKWTARARLQRGRLERERDGPEAALATFRAALETATADCDDSVVATVRAEFAATLSRAGKRERALAQSGRALDAVPDGYRLLEFRARVAHAGALRRAGATEDARTRLEHLLEETTDASATARLRCLLELGGLELETGAAEAGRERLATGREFAAEIGATLYADRFDRCLERRRAEGVEPPSGGRSERDGEPGAAER